MKFTTAFAAVAFAGTALSHTTMFSVWVNDVDQGDGRKVYIRSPPSNSPIKDLASPDLACNVNGGTAVSSFVTAAAGDKLSFEWYHDNRNDDIVDGSHKGPIITYIAPFTTGNGAGPIWTKIAEEGFDGSQWAVDKLKTTGKQDFTLPSALKAGKYLIRQEIIALHEADATFDKNPARGAQFYPSCVQVEVTGSGSALPSEDFDFNTGYKYSDPGIFFNLYGSFSSYTIPGPAVDDLSGSSGSAPADPSTPAASTLAVVSTSSIAAVSSAVRTTLATVIRSSVAATVITSAPTVTPSSSSVACGGTITVTVSA